MTDVSDAGIESSPALEQARRRVGAVLRGKWTLDELIGIGGMGAVYAATHRNGRRAAIKVLLPLHGTDRRTVHRFLKEGYVANELAHPGAVEIFDDDYTDDGLPFLVMDLLRGRSLKAKLEEPPGRLELGAAIRVGVEVLAVLSAAHERGIVHRDVKPDNVFLLDDGRIKLLDFGIARLRTLTEAGHTTSSGAMLGTAAFMAPEQARGKAGEVDARSDIFGVGATLFVALSGCSLREAETTSELLLFAMTEPARPLGDVAPDVPKNVAAVVDRALSFAAEARWPSAAAMRDALVAASNDLVSTSSGGAEVRSAEPPAGSGRRRSVVAFMAAVGLLLMIGGVFAIVLRPASQAVAPGVVDAPTPLHVATASAFTPLPTTERDSAAPALLPSAPSTSAVRKPPVTTPLRPSMAPPRASGAETPKTDPLRRRL